MVLLIKNGKTLKVTNGAAQKYLSAGWKRCNDSTPAINTSVENEAADQNETEDEADTDAGFEGDFTKDENEEPITLSEIPLAEMTMGQLKEYAEELGVSYSASTDKRQLRNLIKKHLRKE